MISAIQYYNSSETAEEGSPTASGRRTTPLNKYALKPNQSTVSNFTSSGPWFSLTWGYSSERVQAWIPSINVRAFNWLYNREFLEGNIQRPVAVTATAILVHPTVVANKDLVVNAQSMLSNATLPDIVGGSRIILSLPLTADATMVNLGKNIAADPMTASAILRTNITINTSSIDEIVLYVYHDDITLYLREDLVK